MNAERIVEALLEGELTPEEFLASAPDLLAHYEFIPFDRSTLEVKRWSGGMYDYIGKVMRADNGGWFAYCVAPGLKRGMSYRTTDVKLRPTKGDAADDLWKLYQKEGDY